MVPGCAGVLHVLDFGLGIVLTRDSQRIAGFVMSINLFIQSFVLGFGEGSVGAIGGFIISYLAIDCRNSHDWCGSLDCYPYPQIDHLQAVPHRYFPCWISIMIRKLGNLFKDG